MEGDYYHEDIHTPHNLQVEKTILGSLLKDNSLYEQIIFLKENDFFEPFHGKLFKKIVTRINSDQLADRITMTEFFTHNDVDFQYLEEICTFYSYNLKGYGEVLRDISKRRQILKIGKQLIKSATDDVSVNEQISNAERQIFEMQINAGEHNTKFISAFQGVSDLLSNLEDMAETGEKPGIRSGYPKLDELLGGFRKGELFILAGRPATGKTAFALNMAHHISRHKREGGGVLFVSLEMSQEQICARIVSLSCDVPLGYLVQGNIPRNILDNCINSRHQFSDMSLFINDCSFITIHSLKSTVRQIKRTHNIEIVIIDYLQLIESPTSKNDNREVEISKISRGLKLMAKELEVSVIALSQLSRDIEKRRDTPRLSDLRGSGAIEQDADNIAILYIPDEDIPDEVCLYLGKNRNGAVGEIYLRFEGQYTKFSSLHSLTIKEETRSSESIVSVPTKITTN
jgi:replicative DNA helicase